MMKFFTKLLILCILIALIGCTGQIKNQKEFTNNISEEREETSFLYSLSPEKNTIFKNESAIYVGVIENNADNDYFLIEINDSNFIFESFSVLVMKNDTTAFDIRMKPKSTVEDCRAYLPSLSIKSINSGSYIIEKRIVPVFILDNCHFPRDGDY